MVAQLRRHLIEERVLRRVEFFPSRGDAREESGPICLAGEEAGPRGILPGEAEHVIQECGRAVELRRLGNAERLELLAETFEDLHHR